MKDRIYKMLIMIAAIPFTWGMLLIVASLCLILPIIAFIWPEKIEIEYPFSISFKNKEQS
jgi:hypothetical protein